MEKNVNDETRHILSSEYSYGYKCRLSYIVMTTNQIFFASVECPIPRLKFYIKLLSVQRIK